MSLFSYLTLFFCIASFCIITLTALPEGCGGVLGTISITSVNAQRLSWTCSNINPNSVPGSGDNLLLSHSIETDVNKCGTYCVNKVDAEALTAAFWYPHNTTCQCWNIGSPTNIFTAARNKASNITLIYFYDAPPSPAVKSGVFTCPPGANGVKWSSYGTCDSLSVTPAYAPLIKGALGLAACESAKAEYAIRNSKGTFDCYKGLSKAKYQYQYSSKLTLYDLLDFKTHSYRECDRINILTRI